MKQNTALPVRQDPGDAELIQYIKSYMFIKGFAVGKSLKQTMVALSLARQLHDGQHRKDGTPYIAHPLKVCSTLISYGIDDDVTLAAALLHDVLEDCGDRLPLGGRELVLQYHLDQEILDLLSLLTKESGLDDHELAVYFGRIQANPKAALIKLSDRLHNSSTLYTFTFQRMRKYLRETARFLLPMASYCKRYYPDYANAFGILKSGIDSMNRSMSVMLDKIEAMAVCQGKN
ncbi:HD domain-containing protein [Pseudoflavonifractor phocaeensis]|uniref:HD domain-containing protein n=1 Tax=Pseudoflavonifractor phocaeensis TaxID=1870988 RepID=UPI00195D8D56|nr:HD domain-containing protein [Pseudoflavonifractor phocaeensis]MBM6870099.1 HD domain-containing protein [Pseudoflavonifractor phocaeensis]MBM6937813.1 HD domain-containing protein [Pseudoflavonifractor phocaeensis]